MLVRRRRLPRSAELFQINPRNEVTALAIEPPVDVNATVSYDAVAMGSDQRCAGKAAGEPA
jgi:hypothetical protein